MSLIKLAADNEKYNTKRKWDSIDKGMDIGGAIGIGTGAGMAIGAIPHLGNNYHKGRVGTALMLGGYIGGAMIGGGVGQIYAHITKKRNNTKLKNLKVK
jgi:hypothetical protein